MDDTLDLELAVLQAKFDPRQPRDANGRWTEIPGGGGVEALYGGHAGTPEDPVPCGDDIERAAIIISNHGNVTLDQADEVATLLNELRKLVKDAEAKGEKAPTYDLCGVSVPGTNLFCQDNVRRPDGTKIDRIEMPQLSTKDPVPGSVADSKPRNKKGEVNLSEEFGKALADAGYATRNTTILASHLRASQNELDGGKVAGIAGAVAAGKIDVTDPAGAIYVTRDNYVIDGHHRWAAYVGEGIRTGQDIDMPIIEVDTDIGTALTFANFWSEQMGIPPADVTKKGMDGWLARTMTRVPEMADIIAKLAESEEKAFDERLHPRDAEGQFTETPGGGPSHSDLEMSPFLLPDHLSHSHGKPHLSYAQSVQAHKEEHGWSTPFGPLPEDLLPKLTWSREEGGYRSGNWFIRRTVDDDPENSYGTQTQWVIEDNGQPVEQHNSLSDAKRDVARMQAARDAKKAFDPAKHPRNAEGQFTETPGGGSPLVPRYPRP